MIRRWSRIAVLTGALILFLASLSVIGHAQHFDLPARSAILIEAETGQILFEKNADEPLPPASLVKTMTLLVAMDAVKAGHVRLDDEVRASSLAARRGGSRVFLAEGEVHTLENLLKAVAIASGNDAAVAVAEYIGGSVPAFTNMMNARAQEIGMTNSRFFNADGLPPGPGEELSLASARDMAKAAQALILYHPEVLEWTSTKMENFRESPLFILYNTNRLVGRYEGLDGLKTGYTEAAGWCLIGTAVRGETRLISVVMGTASQDQREEQTRAILDHGFNRFAPLLVADGRVGEIRMATASPEVFDVTVHTPVTALHPVGMADRVSTELVPYGELDAPLRAGDPVGELIVRFEDEELFRVTVHSEVDVERANAAVRLWRSARDFARGIIGRE